MKFPLTSLLNTGWLINGEAVWNMLPLLIAYLNGREIDLSAIVNTEENKPYILAISQGEQVNLCNTYELQNELVPANSVAIIPIQGVILPDKLMELVANIRLADSNPNVISVLFPVNTPGGSVFYLDTAADAIKAMRKPSIGYGMNMVASAGMWLFSSMTYRAASSPMDRFGSVGVMTSSMDATRFLKEKLNIDIIDLYATASTRKNEEMRALRNTDLPMEERTKLIIKDLDYINAFFHEAIQTNLSIAPESEVFAGAVYYSQQAIEFGLVQEINTFENTLMLAQRMGLKNTINQMFHSN